MRALVGIPTISRADLLLRNKPFLEGLAPADEALVIDNGHQRIDINVPVIRPPKNLGVAGSWNAFMRRAFTGPRPYDLLVLLQDDIIWDASRLAEAKRLLQAHPDVDLFLSPFQFAVQVHRPTNLKTIGLYDERFFPAWCEDDDYALTIIKYGRVYQRFASLDPLPGSISNGTEKKVAWTEQKAKLVAKWGRDFGVNDMDAPHYWTNRGLRGIL
jgi:GT2 family glycosyltransferase